MDERGHELCTTRAKWVTEGNGSAINIQPFGIRSEILQPCERDWCKRLVHFKQADVVDRSSGSLERAAGRLTVGSAPLVLLFKMLRRS